MKPCRLAALLCALTISGGLPATSVLAHSGGWHDPVIEDQAGPAWLIAVKLHPRETLSAVEQLPAEALETVAQLTGHTAEFLGRHGARRDSFLLRLIGAQDYDAAANAANALRMMPEVLWVSLVPEHAGPDLHPEHALGEASAPGAADTVAHFQVVFNDPATRSARSRQDVLPELLIQAMSKTVGSDVQLVRPMSGGAWVFAFPEEMSREDADDAMRRLRAMPQVELADLDQQVHAQLQPNDPLFQYQYNLLPPGINGPWGAPVFGINATQAWDITTGSSNTRVAVVDTGALFNHPDLAGRFLGGYDFVDNDSNASDPGTHCPQTGTPSTWHGTHVAGTIAANTNDGVGAAGVDWRTRVLPVRVLGPCSSGSAADVIDGMRWAVGLPVPGAPANSNPARIVNLSLAGPGQCPPIWQQAIDDVTAAGALVVVAAGNQDTSLDLYTPASCNGVITVVASDPHGNKASYSNFGTVRMPELAAPGGDLARFNDFRAGIIAAGNAGTTGPTSSNWISKAGTSMAAPHVAGVASLMLAVNPALTASQLYSLITSVNNLTPFSATSDFSLNYPRGGRGILNARLAVQAAQSTLPPAPPPGGAMLLRDAIYLYDQPLTANGDKVLTGVDCDVFKLVLDVKSGYTDLAMGGGTSLTAALGGHTPFPARILSTAPMFAYSLYGSQQVKTFSFSDAVNSGSAANIGSATVFGYCFSRNPHARVYLHDKTVCENTYSDGRKTACTASDNGTGGAAPTAMTLRDAIYLYGEDVREDSELQLGGSNCDVLQLLLDVESGYSDLRMYEGGNVLEFPARILDSANMFAYALYSSAPNKAFGLGDITGASTNRTVGRATAFAYCYSTQPGAYVFRKDPMTQACTNSADQAIICP